MNPIRVDVVIPTLTALGYECKVCALVSHQLDLHKKYLQDCRDDYPEDLKQENVLLIHYINTLKQLYKHRICFRIIDAHSPMGLFKQLIHWPSKLPIFIVDKKVVCVGWKIDELEKIIDQRIRNDSQDLSNNCEPD